MTKLLRELNASGQTTGMNQCTGAELGTQVFEGNGPFDPERFIPVEPNEYPRMKPRKGGLWTAQWDEQHGGGWVQWCLGEEWNVAPDKHWDMTLLEPEPDARILVIDSYADLAAAFERFPEPYPKPWSYSRDGHIAWHLVAEEFDAVHLTDKGQWDTRLSMPLDLYGWDCESTLWFRLAFRETNYIGRHEFVVRPGEDERAVLDCYYDDDEGETQP